MSSRTPLRSVEFIHNGEVIESRQVPEGTRSFRLEKEVKVDASCWFAVRATGVPARGMGMPRAHSGAIYVKVGGRPTLVRQDVELMIRWLDRLWLSLEERNNFGPGDNRQRARLMIAEARKHYEGKLSVSR